MLRITGREWCEAIRLLRTIPSRGSARAESSTEAVSPLALFINPKISVHVGALFDWLTCLCARPRSRANPQTMTVVPVAGPKKAPPGFTCKPPPRRMKRKTNKQQTRAWLLSFCRKIGFLPEWLASVSFLWLSCRLTIPLVHSVLARDATPSCSDSANSPYNLRPP